MKVALQMLSICCISTEIRARILSLRNILTVPDLLLDITKICIRGVYFFFGCGIMFIRIVFGTFIGKLSIIVKIGIYSGNENW